ncbi:MAG: hypothetical protein E4G91_03875 [Candidatus Zixiibacteriota bacterium]|nr:MAG: hypothetical protein E4G91_03875 [candidate division Zixibacteria bacterium]
MDEAGAPVNNAHLNIRFSSNSGTVKGFTDDHGIFEAKAMSNDGVILGDIMKDGYYEGGIAHSFFVTRVGMWQPWGKEITVVMRPIVNPVPMYVRDKIFKLPAHGKEVGFDLEKADWVIPYGLGTQADFIFKVEKSFVNMDNYDATMFLTFSNPFDGIQVVKDDGGGDFNAGSRYRLPRTAPDTDYLPNMQKRISRGSYGRHSDMEDDNNYIFRVRSEVDINGKLKKAMYGKIRGELRYAAGDGGMIKMHYYLNPDYTRNLEFDPTRNLFKLPDGEWTGQP